MSLFPCYRLAGTVAGLEDAASDKMGKKNPYPLRADTVEEGVRCQQKHCRNTRQLRIRAMEKNST